MPKWAVQLPHPLLATALALQVFGRLLVETQAKETSYARIAIILSGQTIFISIVPDMLC